MSSSTDTVIIGGVAYTKVEKSPGVLDVWPGSILKWTASFLQWLWNTFIGLLWIVLILFAVFLCVIGAVAVGRTMVAASGLFDSFPDYFQAVWQGLVGQYYYLLEAKKLVTWSELVNFFILLSAAKNLAGLFPTVWFKFKAERAVDGSLRMPVKAPKFQCEILALDGTLIGQGFRAEISGEDVLVTAYHCLSDKVIVRSPIGKITIDRDDFECRPGADVAFLPYAGLVQLGLAKAKLGCVSGQQVVSVSCSGFGTMGTLESLNYGTLSYSGSTWGGVSGAPYFLGNFVFGMHLGALGSINMGLEASYLHVVRLADEGMDSEFVEDSDEYLQRNLEQGAAYEWKHTGDPDVVSIKMYGRYHLVDTTTEIGGQILNRVRKGRGKWEESAKIPTSALPAVVPEFGDQVSGAFLGKTPLVIRPQRSMPEVPSSIPTTENLALAGPIPPPKQFGNRSPSTKKSPSKAETRRQRKSSIALLLDLFPTLSAGDRKAVVENLNAPLSGLTELLTRLSRPSTGKRQLDTAV